MVSQSKINKIQRHYLMSNIRAQNTKAEVLLRKALWHRGIRYRKNYAKIPGKPDIAIMRCHIAIFVDGYFWHARGHQEHPGEQVKSNPDYWQPKLKRNVERDKEVNDILTSMGWLVLRFWETDIKKNPDKCADQICAYCGRQQGKE